MQSSLIIVEIAVGHLDGDSPSQTKAREQRVLNMLVGTPMVLSAKRIDQ